LHIGDNDDDDGDDDEYYTLSEPTTFSHSSSPQTAIRVATQQADVGALEALIPLKVPHVDQKIDGQILASQLIQASEDDGFSPLHYASFYGATTLLSLLLVQKGVVVDARDGMGKYVMNILTGLRK